MTNATAVAIQPGHDRIDVDYCRISYDKSGQAAGVDSQHLENVEVADEENRAITATYSDNDISAYDTSKARPDYNRMCRDIAAGRIASITFFAANRLHRDIEQASKFLKLCITHSVRLFSVTKGGEYNIRRAGGRNEFLRDTLKGQEESDERGDRVTLARKRQARNGDWGGGVRAYGWGLVTTEPLYREDKRRGRVVREPIGLDDDGRPLWLDMTKHNVEEANEIRSWKTDLLGGVSKRQVLASLAKRNVLTVSQKDGRALRRNGKAATHGGWNSKTIIQILTHPRTAGHAVYKGEIIKYDAYPAIITEDERQALITLFGDPTRKTSPGNTPKWFGSLIYRCGVCDNGATMTVRNNSRGVPVYQHNGHCSRPAAEVDQFIAAVIVARLSRADVADLLPSRSTVDVTALRDDLRILESRKMAAAQQFAAGTIDGPMMTMVAASVDQQAAEIRAQLQTAAAESPLSPFAVTDNTEDTWDALSLGHRREILRTLATVTLKPAGRGYRSFDPSKALRLVPIEFPAAHAA